VEQRLQDNVFPGASHILEHKCAWALLLDMLIAGLCGVLYTYNNSCPMGSVVLMATVAVQLLGFSTTATGIMVQFTTAGAAIGFLIGGACPISQSLFLSPNEVYDNAVLPKIMVKLLP